MLEHWRGDALHWTWVCSRYYHGDWSDGVFVVDLGVVGEGLLHHGRQIDFLIFWEVGRKEGAGRERDVSGPFAVLFPASYNERCDGRCMIAWPKNE